MGGFHSRPTGCITQQAQAVRGLKHLQLNRQHFEQLVMCDAHPHSNPDTLLSSEKLSIGGFHSRPRQSGASNTNSSTGSIRGPWK
jgi:hypothetical protein